jgi:hypothetical protein
MGAGYATGQYGPSMTELFVGGDTRTAPGEPDAPVVSPIGRDAPQQPVGATGAAAGATSSTPAARPAPRTRVLRLKLTTGQLELKALCGGPRGSVCKVVITIAVPRGRSARHISASYAAVSIPAGQSRLIRVPLGRAARRLLSTDHKLSVRVVIRRAGRRRAVTVLSRTLTLGAPA